MGEAASPFGEYPARCVVAVRSRSAQQAPFAFRGTGCLIADDLVLTARHVVGAAESLEIQFGFARGSPTMAAKVCWRGEEELTDIALLRLVGASSTPVPHPSGIRLARVHRDGGGAQLLPCTALGFPGFARGRLNDPPLPYVDAFEVRAHVPLNTSVRGGRLRSEAHQRQEERGP
ncbi:trypsin-like peptidase domain-containing protein [Streptomyces tauricus]|uniref:trypsin-like peptidase domain-containing protein n=1 Tax=Streptomyces tauricus TaxID=68274 RepID=UPI003908056D